MLLFRTSGLDLRLEPTHPDLAGGLGFLEQATMSFLSLQVAAGAVLAGRLVIDLAARAADLRIAKQEIVGFSLITIAMTLGPLVPFSRKLVLGQRRGKLDYGRLSSRHNQQFADRWLGDAGGAPLGDPSISSLADLGTSYGSIDRMRPLPVGRHSLITMLGLPRARAPRGPRARSFAGSAQADREDRSAVAAAASARRQSVDNGSRILGNPAA